MMRMMVECWRCVFLSFVFWVGSKGSHNDNHQAGGSISHPINTNPNLVPCDGDLPLTRLEPTHHVGRRGLF